MRAFRPVYLSVLQGSVRSDGSGGDRVQHHRQHRICSSQNASWIYGQDSSQGTNDLQNSICIIVPASAY